MNIWGYLAILALNFVVSAYSGRKGKNKFVWFIISILISPFVAALILFFLKPSGAAADQPPKSSKDLLGAGIALTVIFFVIIAGSDLGERSTSPSRQVEATASNTPAPVAAAPTPAVAADDDASRFTVSSFTLHRNEYGGVSVGGVLQNNTGKEYSYVQIELNVYDKDGTQLGSDLANVNNLEPHARWKFETPIIQEGADSVKIKNITAF